MNNFEYTKNSDVALTPSEEDITRIKADFAAKRFSEVITAATVLTERFPAHEFGWRALGSASYVKGDVSGALVATERAVALSPQPDSRCNLARLYLHQKEYDRAMDQCTEALKETPNLVEAKKLLSNILELLKRPEVTFKYMSDRVARNPGDITAHVALAMDDMHHGRLPEALARFRHALNLGLTYPWVDIPPQAKARFDTKANIRAFRQTLVSLCADGVQAFATAGTLLGLERDGRLLSFDKDLDIGVPMEQMDMACRSMRSKGWSELVHPMSLRSPRSFKHAQLKLFIDIFGFEIEKASGQLIGGIWSSKIPQSWQRITDYGTKLALHKTNHHYGEVWELDDPNDWLTRIYGDWRTPDPLFDTVISAHNLRNFSLLTESYALMHINKALLEGSLKKALALVRQTKRHLPAEELLQQLEVRLQSIIQG
uniref:tetratricopeptide repeat protein n=1 Tax=Cellvibrio fontiphilus TaxID=1815559 RepID=UPI002B4BC5B4|nr:hypothetical protein [Cellvibrio fontiphilus]